MESELPALHYFDVFFTSLFLNPFFLLSSLVSSLSLPITSFSLIFVYNTVLFLLIL